MASLAELASFSMLAMLLDVNQSRLCHHSCLDGHTHKSLEEQECQVSNIVLMRYSRYSANSLDVLLLITVERASARKEQEVP